LGRLQNTEKEEEFSDIEKTEGPGGWKSQRPTDEEVLAIEVIDRTTEDPCRAHKKGQNWIWMR
jgi:hypothetical protein